MEARDVTDRTIPDAVNEVFAAITGDLEDAAAIAASAQNIRNRVEAMQAVLQIREALRFIERRLANLEAQFE